MALFALAEGVALTQSDGDLFAHIRLGQIILGGSAIPATSVLGFSFGGAAVYPAWLAAVWFAALHSIGGLAFIVATTAVVAGLSHGAVSLLFRRRGLNSRANLLASLLALALAASHWLARPHEFTLLFTALLLVLLETPGTWVAIACGFMFLLWGNLHGGWAFGLVLIACVVTTFFAFRASRNIALFGLVAWPLIALHLLSRPAAEVGSDTNSTLGSTGVRLHRVGLVAVPFAGVLLLLGVLHGSIAGR